MNHLDPTSAPQIITTHHRKAYALPAILIELDLETRAGNSVYNPGCAGCASAQEDSSLESFNSK